MRCGSSSTTSREHVVTVVLPSPEDGGARGDGAAFAESLRPGRWPENDFTGPSVPYRPGRVAVVYVPVTSGTGTPRGQPLPEREPIGPRCAVLTGRAATRAQELAETAPLATSWRHGDGTCQAVGAATAPR